MRSSTVWLERSIMTPSVSLPHASAISTKLCLAVRFPNSAGFMASPTVKMASTAAGFSVQAAYIPTRMA